MAVRLRLVRREYVGDRVRSVMDGFGWSEVRAATFFKVSQQTIRNWLAEDSRMTEVHLRKLEGRERLLANRAEAAKT